MPMMCYWKEPETICHLHEPEGDKHLVVYAVYTEDFYNDECEPDPTPFYYQVAEVEVPASVVEESDRVIYFAKCRVAWPLSQPNRQALQEALQSEVVNNELFRRQIIRKDDYGDDDVRF